VTPSHRWHAPALTRGEPIASITVRQAQILAGIALGHTNVEIADRLVLSEDTVRTHVKSLLKALGARNRAHAAALACSGQLEVHVRGDYQRSAA